MPAAHQIDAFRRSARAWLEANFPPSLKDQPDAALEVMMAGAAPSPDLALWMRRMSDKGWGAPSWPRECGGAGLSADEAAVLQDELDRLGAANPIVGMGVNNVGPVLLEFGTDDQRRRHMPPIARAERRWCQGYSEPGAGSDLAALATRCEDAGDCYLVNGHKIWTSGAQHADWCFCLVRTDPARKHDGISFVLIDMRQPGVVARPIELIAGVSTFCETFFTDARVEKNDVVGPLNGGWAVAKRQLQHERSGQARRRAAAAQRLDDLARRFLGADADERIADADLRARIVANEIDAHAHRLALARGAARGAASSAMKNASVAIGQARSELAIEIMGLQGLGWAGEGFGEDELDAVRAWLRGKAGSIAGGTAEIQNNVIAKRILGLPDPPGGGRRS